MQKSIMFIGNGPIDYTKKNGEFIDSCDLVVRFNKCVLNDDYKDYIGSKTDIHVMNRHKVDDFTLQNYSSNKFFICGSIDKAKFFKFLRKYIKNDSFSNSTFLCKGFYKKMIKRINYKSKKKLSAGLIMMYYVLNNENLKDYKIYISNFTHNADHYYEKCKSYRIKYYSTHNWNFEKNYFKELINENKISVL